MIERKSIICEDRTLMTALAMCLVASGLAWGQTDRDANNSVLVRQPFAKGVVRVALQHKTASPDGKLFAGYYRDEFAEVISIHDAETGKQIKRIVGYGDNVTRFKFTQDKDRYSCKQSSLCS